MVNDNIFRLLNINGVNAHIPHQAFNDNKKMKKTDFLKIFADDTVRPYLHKSATNTKLKWDQNLQRKSWKSENLVIVLHRELFIYI